MLQGMSYEVPMTACLPHFEAGIASEDQPPAGSQDMICRGKYEDVFMILHWELECQDKEDKGDVGQRIVGKEWG